MRSKPTIAIQNLEDNMTSTVNNTMKPEDVENKSIREESVEESYSPRRSFGVQFTEETTESPFKTS